MYLWRYLFYSFPIENYKTKTLPFFRHIEPESHETSWNHILCAQGTIWGRNGLGLSFIVFLPKTIKLRPSHFFVTGCVGEWIRGYAVKFDRPSPRIFCARLRLTTNVWLYSPMRILFQHNMRLGWRAIPRKIVSHVKLMHLHSVPISWLIPLDLSRPTIYYFSPPPLTIS